MGSQVLPVGYLSMVQGDGSGTWVSPNPGSQAGSGVQGKLLQILRDFPRCGWLVLLAHTGYKSMKAMEASRLVGTGLPASPPCQCSCPYESPDGIQHACGG